VKEHSKRTHIGDRALHPESLMMSYGYEPGWSEGAVKPPIFQTSTFVFESAEAGKAFFEVAYGLRERGEGEAPGLIYSRLNNPGLEILQDRLTLWDRAEAALVFESGMSAITTAMLAFLRPGDIVAFPEPIYGGTEYLFHKILPEFGIEPLPFPGSAGVEELDRLLSEGDRRSRLRVLHLETPANPTNLLVDIEACVALARTGGRPDRPTLVAVDNTFLGPVFQRPLEQGADLVLYSLTKYVGGHSDLIAGACLGRQELIQQVAGMRTIMGTMAGPWTSWLLLRSLETMQLRMHAQMENARKVADFLLTHPAVTRVNYLGHLVEGTPQHDIYRKQCLAPGAMISFEVEGGEAEAFRFLNALQMVKLAVSLGGTESLAEHPGTMTHSDLTPESQRVMGINPALVRLSVGIEHADDIIADLDQALGQIRG